MPDPGRHKWTTGLNRAGTIAVLSLPLFLLHGRGVAEALVMLLDACFLLHCLVARDWDWRRLGWLPWALAWWAWLVACSVPAGWGATGQALGLGRFLLLVAALESWALRDAAVRAWLARLVRWAALYIALQAALQFAAGRNLFGQPRGPDGELTGPYEHPRAAPPFARLLFPALLPPVARWIVRPPWPALGAVALTLASLAILVLMGQRMPLLLALLGLFVTALLLPRLHGAVLYACVAAGLLLAVSSSVSPEAHHRLVTKFAAQMESFPESHYGLLAARSVAMVRAHPLTGLGFDGFRRGCDDPAYFQGWHAGSRADPGGGAAICVQHPHNFYLQAAVEAGLPGLALFCAMALAWLRGLGRGLWTNADPLRAGLFVAALLHLWPLSSTSAFSSMPLSGWFFLLLGLGLAEARAYMTANPPAP